MKEPVTLELHLQVRAGVMEHASVGVARLDPDVAEELKERVAVLPRSVPVRLSLHLTRADGVREIAALIRHHYAMLRERAEYRLMGTVRAGRFSLLIGIVVLLVALALAEAVRRMTTGSVGVVLEEGLTIVGWVALWRPLDLMLFERWALRREIALCRRLEEMEIGIAEEPRHPKP